MNRLRSLALPAGLGNSRCRAWPRYVDARRGSQPVVFPARLG